MGIDNLEHGFAAMTDFVAGQQPDACPLAADSPTCSTMSIPIRRRSAT